MLIFAFYSLAIVQICVGVYLIWQGLQWLSYVRRRLSTDPGFYAPRTAVICPCKGLEQGLERNLVALTEFNHQNYEVFFTLASESDPAYSIVKRVASQSRVKAHVIVAGRANGCSEKVHNLSAAVQQVPPEFEIFVFVDSDGRPGKSWLHHMVAPLTDSRLGATTTMRWFIPNRNDLATALLAAWNAPVVTMLTEKGPNFCWGGGTAIRRTVFEEANVLERWQNSVSDDYSMTRALNETQRPICFLPECLMPSYIETNFASLLEFTNRQVLITRVYAEKTWSFAFATHTIYCLTFLLGVDLALGNWVTGFPAFNLATLTFLPLLLAAIRGALRVAAVTEVLPSMRTQIMNQGWIYIVLTVVVPFLYLVNFVNSLVTRKISWRGVRYELLSAEQTRILTS